MCHSLAGLFQIQSVARLRRHFRLISMSMFRGSTTSIVFATVFIPTNFASQKVSVNLRTKKYVGPQPTLYQWSRITARYGHLLIASHFPGVHYSRQVWSAPNYCYRCGNVASILVVDEKLNREFRIFNAVPKSADSVPPRQVVPYFI